MRNLLKVLFAWVVLPAALLVSCQHDENETLSNTKALSKSSELTTGLYRLAMNNTSVDNFIDHSSAFRIEFPYQAIVNGQSIGLASEADYQTIRDIFAASASDVDSITLAFPLTVSLVNYTQQLLGSQQALDDFRDNTAAPGNPAIPCIAVQYPVVISVYDSNIQNAQNFTINNKPDLFGFVAGLSQGQLYQINYPVSAVNSSGELVVIQNDTEFLDAINVAAEDCSCGNPNILTDDLVMYIPFGNELHDLTGNSEMLISGNYHYVTDRSGNANGAISMDDATNNGQNTVYAEGNAANNMMASGSFSMSIWYKRQDNSGINPQEQLASNFAFTALLGNPDNTVMGPYLMDMSDEVIYDDSWVTDGLGNDITNWHHLVISYDSSLNLGKLYRDGQLRRTFTCNDMPTSIPSYSFANRYKGFMDDIRIYKKALTANQVATLYNLEGDINQCMN